MKILKNSLVVLLSFVWLSGYAQLADTSNVIPTETKKEITYQDYLKLQEAYKKGEISKAKLEKAFNQMADKWDQTCTPKKVESKKKKEITTMKTDQASKVEGISIVQVKKEQNNLIVAAN